MRHVFLLAVAVSFFGSIVSEVLALGGDHSAGKISVSYNPEWPKKLPDLINSADQIGGYWINQADFFHFRGAVESLNKFLESYGKLTETPLKVVLHTGEKPLTGPLGGPRNVPFAWRLEVIRRGWGEPLDPRRPKDKPGYVVTVHVWLGEGITLERLDIPKHVDVRSAGDIERFIDAHRKRAAE